MPRFILRILAIFSVTEGIMLLTLADEHPLGAFIFFIPCMVLGIKAENLYRRKTKELIDAASMDRPE